MCESGSPVRGGSWKTPGLCHELSCSPCRRQSSAVPFLHIAPPSRSVPLHAVRAAAGLGAPNGGTLFARVSCLRARARPRASCAGAVRAPDCARETADAPVPSPPAGFFSAPAALLRRKAERRPQGTASLHPLYTTFSSVKPLEENFFKFSRSDSVPVQKFAWFRSGCAASSARRPCHHGRTRLTYPLPPPRRPRRKCLEQVRKRRERRTRPCVAGWTMRIPGSPGAIRRSSAGCRY